MSADACAACGKGGDGLKKCSGCKQLKFCNTTCQRSAWSSHKKECKRLAANRKAMLYKLALTEETNDALFKPPSPKEECGICMLPMPFVAGHPVTQAIYLSCCGTWWCEGCGYSDSEHSSSCPFCRTTFVNSPREGRERCQKRANANDADGTFRLGLYYNGFRGLPKDPTKAAELFQQAAEMGSVHAHYDLAIAFLNGDGVKEDHWKALHHFRLAAIKGHEEARRWVGNCESELGFTDRAMQHYMISASCGYEVALKEVGEGYKKGLVSKDDYAKTLRAFKESLDEMKSEQRAEASAARASLIPEMSGSVVHPSRTDIVDPNDMRRTGRPPTYAEKTNPTDAARYQSI